MRTTKRHYKEVIRGRMISMRLTEEEFLLIKMGALRERTSVSRLMRRGVAGLIEGAATEATPPMIAVTAPVAVPTATLTEVASSAIPSADASTTAAVASTVAPAVEAIPTAAAVAPSSGITANPAANPSGIAAATQATGTTTATQATAIESRRQ